MKKSFTIIVLALIASAAIAQTFSMEDLEGLRINPVDEGLQGPLTGLDIVSVSFDVDKNLPAPKEALPKYDDKEIARRLVNISAVPDTSAWCRPMPTIIPWCCRPIWCGLSSARDSPAM